MPGRIPDDALELLSPEAIKFWRSSGVEFGSDLPPELEGLRSMAAEERAGGMTELEIACAAGRLVTLGRDEAMGLITRVPTEDGGAWIVEVEVDERTWRMSPEPPLRGVPQVRAIVECVTSIQPELWVEGGREAVAFYEAAFGATTVHLVGEGNDIVAQLGVGDAAFWVATASPAMKRLDPRTADGTTGRTLLVVEDPSALMQRALAAGATETSPVAIEHGWQVGRLVDPFGHEWEIGKPIGPWPPQ